MSERTDPSHVVQILQRCRSAFTYRVDRFIRRDSPGIYAFWLGTKCLYVGMSTQLGVRIHQHRLQERNDVLLRWFHAFPREIEIAVATMEGSAQTELRKIERHAIRALMPEANKTHRRH